MIEAVVSAQGEATHSIDIERAIHTYYAYVSSPSAQTGRLSLALLSSDAALSSGQLLKYDSYRIFICMRQGLDGWASSSVLKAENRCNLSRL
jgi:hypothetical protein